MPPWNDCSTQNYNTVANPLVFMVYVWVNKSSWYLMKNVVFVSVGNNAAAYLCGWCAYMYCTCVHTAPSGRKVETRWKNCKAEKVAGAILYD